MMMTTDRQPLPHRLISPTWRDRLAAAQAPAWWKLWIGARGFSAIDKILAKGWTTCAVGEQWRMHPDVIAMTEGYSGPVPADRQLRLLGSGHESFHQAVLYNRFDLAEQRLDEIEDRVLELKRRR